MYPHPTPAKGAAVRMGDAGQQVLLGWIWLESKVLNEFLLQWKSVWIKCVDFPLPPTFV